MAPGEKTKGRLHEDDGKRINLARRLAHAVAPPPEGGGEHAGGDERRAKREEASERHAGQTQRGRRGSQSPGARGARRPVALAQHGQRARSLDRSPLPPRRMVGTDRAGGGPGVKP